MTTAELAEAAPLNATELMAALGLKKSRFHQLRQQGAFRAFEVKRPIGIRRYSRALVEAHLAGESVTRLGRRVG
jgi:hypothetical protein